MTGVVNIRRDISDKYYRYKMPKLVSKVEGKGNGIRTVIPNMPDIAKSLSRPSTYPTKFFGCELGAQVKCDEKNSKYVVNGAHHAEKLQQLLDGFIEKFVLCPACRNPETDLVVVKKNEILRNCKACGAAQPVDMRHKLCTWIFKNPPGQANEGATLKKLGIKLETRRLNSSQKSAFPSTEIQPMTMNSSLTMDLMNSSGIMGSSSVIDASTGGVESSNTEDDKIFGEIQDVIDLSWGMDRLNVSAKNEDISLEEFGVFLSETQDASHEEILSRASALRPDKVSAILPQVLFTTKILDDKEVERQTPLLRKLVKSEKSQRAFLGGIERLIGIIAPELMDKTPYILKALYDNEIIQEDIFLLWGEKPTGKYIEKKISKEIHKRAGSFINWLKEAEEESESEQEEQE